MKKGLWRGRLEREGDYEDPWFLQPGSWGGMWVMRIMSFLLPRLRTLAPLSPRCQSHFPLSSQLGTIPGFPTWDIILSDSRTYGMHTLLLSCCFLGSPDLHENASQSCAFRQSLSTSHQFQVWQCLGVKTNLCWTWHSFLLLLRWWPLFAI